MTFGKDFSQIPNGQAPRNLASQRLAITIPKLAGKTNIAKAARTAHNYLDHALNLVGVKTS